MNSEEKNEETFIKDIKQSIHDTTRTVSDKVVQSAYAHLLKNGCLAPEKEALAKSFFVNKIPEVIANKVSKELNTVLGLDLDI
jgi:hypothetical protein